MQSEARATGRGSLQVHPLAAGLLCLTPERLKDCKCKKKDPFRERLHWLAGLLNARWKICTVVLEGIQLQFRHITRRPRIQFVH